MKVIAGRHIRHDWQTFVDWEQKSVRTVCGMTSQARLCGIPGISEQPNVVGNRWGWCVKCAVKAFITSQEFTSNPAYDGHIMSPRYQSVNAHLWVYWQATVKARMTGTKIAGPVVK